jgi:hypothetical protein
VLRSGGLSASIAPAASAGTAVGRAGAWRARVNSSSPSIAARETPATTHGVRSRATCPSCRGPGRPEAIQCPQEAQNLAPRVTGALHDGHWASPRGVPQEEQNRPVPAAPQAVQVVIVDSDITEI